MRRWWRWAALVVGLLLVGWLVLGLLGGAEKDKVWERIQREGVLRVGMDASYPPFEFVDAQGNIQGLDVDLAEALAERFGARLEIANVGFDSLYDTLQDKKFDIIVSALPYDPFLIKDFAFSHAYFNAGLRWVARPEVLSELPDVGGKRIAVQLGSSADVEARVVQRRFPSMILLTYDEIAQVAEALERGDADAAILDGVSALQFTRTHPEFGVGERLLTDEPYVIAIPLDAPRLKKEVNRALVDFRESGRLDAWVERWLR